MLVLWALLAAPETVGMYSKYSQPGGSVRLTPPCTFSRLQVDRWTAAYRPLRFTKIVNIYSPVELWTVNYAPAMDLPSFGQRCDICALGMCLRKPENRAPSSGARCGSSSLPGSAMLNPGPKLAF